VGQQPDRYPRPRKRFGQHFLADDGVAARFVDLVCPEPNELVVEVGPGRGALTRKLVERVDRLVAVEIDRDLAAGLDQRLASARLRLIEADILQLDLHALLAEEGKERLFIVGNLPYNITAPLLFRLLDHWQSVSRAIVTLQREVAQRLVAPPGNRDYGIITVLLNQRSQAAVRLEISRRAFRPQPKVDSSVVELRFGAQTSEPADQGAFEQVVRSAFSQRRKMLRNSLKGAVPVPDGEATLHAAASSVGIDLSRRAETLSLGEFIALSDAMAAAVRGQTPGEAGANGAPAG